MFTQRIALSNQDARKVSATKLHDLGVIAETPDKRVFRMARAGVSALNPGQLQATSARLANHTNRAVSIAAPVGARQVTVSIGATAMTQDQYRGGYLVINDGPGIGAAYRIAGHPAAASNGSVLVDLEEAIATALVATTSLVTFQPNQFADTIVSTSASLLHVGVPNVAVPPQNYYWAQTGGIASVLSGGIIAKGVGAVASATAGAVETEAAASVSRRVGIAPEATVDTKYYAILLTMDD